MKDGTGRNGGGQTRERNYKYQSSCPCFFFFRSPPDSRSGTIPPPAFTLESQKETCRIEASLAILTHCVFSLLYLEPDLPRQPLLEARVKTDDTVSDWYVLVHREPRTSDLCPSPSIAFLTQVPIGKHRRDPTPSTPSGAHYLLRYHTHYHVWALCISVCDKGGLPTDMTYDIDF